MSSATITSFQLFIYFQQQQKEVKVGLFHGGEEVCESQTTSRQRGIHPVWNEYLEFRLPVANIPRMARICVCIVGWKKREERKKKVCFISINLHYLIKLTKFYIENLGKKIFKFLENWL